MSRGADDEVSAKLQGILINTAIGLQVAFGAITTGVAAAASDGARHVRHSSSFLTCGFQPVCSQVGQVIAALGAISTLLASYLASVRGSGEPEFSTIRERELNTFLREIEAFIMDHGSLSFSSIHLSPLLSSCRVTQGIKPGRNRTTR
jgi:hypothetical protein